jgi:hypothetical protein
MHSCTIMMGSHAFMHYHDAIPCIHAQAKVVETSGGSGHPSHQNIVALSLLSMFKWDMTIQMILSLLAMAVRLVAAVILRQFLSWLQAGTFRKGGIIVLHSGEACVLRKAHDEVCAGWHL